LERHGEFVFPDEPSAPGDVSLQIKSRSTIDLNALPVWGSNFGVGRGAASVTDHLIVKAMLGRRID
jgi:hypothetical protein